MNFGPHTPLEVFEHALDKAVKDMHDFCDATQGLPIFLVNYYPYRGGFQWAEFSSFLPKEVLLEMFLSAAEKAALEIAEGTKAKAEERWLANLIGDDDAP